MCLPRSDRVEISLKFAIFQEKRVENLVEKEELKRDQPKIY